MLFKTKNELQALIPVNLNLDMNLMSPFIQQAERDQLIPYLSQEQYDDLNTAYNGSGTLTDAQAKLLSMCQQPLAFFAFQLAIPYIQVQISNQGIRIVSDETFKTAFQWQIDDLNGSALRAAHSAMDALLDFLEAGKTTYTLWVASSSFTQFKQLFIQTTGQFDDIFNIAKSRRNFLSLKANMRYAEEMYLLPLLGKSYFDDLKTKIAARTLNADDNAIMPDIQKALAHLTMYEAIDRFRVEISEWGIVVNEYKVGRENSREKTSASDQLLNNMKLKAQDDGNMYLDKITIFLKANASSTRFPLFLSSSAYVNPAVPLSTWQNNSDSGIVVL